MSRFNYVEHRTAAIEILDVDPTAAYIGSAGQILTVHFRLIDKNGNQIHARPATDVVATSSDTSKVAVHSYNPQRGSFKVRCVANGTSNVYLEMVTPHGTIRSNTVVVTTAAFSASTTVASIDVLVPALILGVGETVRAPFRARNAAGYPIAAPVFEDDTGDANAHLVDNAISALTAGSATFTATVGAVTGTPLPVVVLAAAPQYLTHDQPKRLGIEATEMQPFALTLMMSNGSSATVANGLAAVRSNSVAAATVAINAMDLEVTAGAVGDGEALVGAKMYTSHGAVYSPLSNIVVVDEIKIFDETGEITDTVGLVLSDTKQLYAKVYADGEEVPNIPLVWATDDDTIADVTETSNPEDARVDVTPGASLSTVANGNAAITVGLSADNTDLATCDLMNAAALDPLLLGYLQDGVFENASLTLKDGAGFTGTTGWAVADIGSFVDWLELVSATAFKINATDASANATQTNISGRLVGDVTLNFTCSIATTATVSKSIAVTVAHDSAATVTAA